MVNTVAQFGLVPTTYCICIESRVCRLNWRILFLISNVNKISCFNKLNLTGGPTPQISGPRKIQSKKTWVKLFQTGHVFLYFDFLSVWINSYCFLNLLLPIMDDLSPHFNITKHLRLHLGSSVCSSAPHFNFSCWLKLMSSYCLQLHPTI